MKTCANRGPSVTTRLRGGRVNDLMFEVQICIERYFAPVLLLWRRLTVGYPYRRIPLTQGRFACVDPEDYAELAKHKWCAARQSNTFYAVRSEGGKQLRMHRVIMNAPADLVVDHIDHDGENNLKRNLRLCTKQQNARNQRPHQNGSSQFAGICWCKHERKWYARITDHGRQRSLGLFADEREAARARDAAAFALWGPFAHLNFPHRRHLLARLRHRLAQLRAKLNRVLMK